MKRLCLSVASLLWLACGPVPASDVPIEGTPIASSALGADGDSTSPSGSAAGAAPNEGGPQAAGVESAGDRAAEPRAKDLPPSTLRDIERVFEKPVVFIAPGRDGRLAVIADEAGQAVPWRFASGAWKRLPLPEAHAAPVAKLEAGIYFGRDDRPRLMGYVQEDDRVRMVYLRFKGGQWRPEPKEIGRLGKAPPRELFGVLGWDDPEVVCKTGDVCLIKSRKGWQEIEPTIAANARVRAFGGKGYAVTSDGLYRADRAGFVRLGPPAPWTTAPAGFRVDAEGEIAVTEPARNRIHVLDAKGKAWGWMDSPVKRPKDVAGPTSGPIVVGAGGMARREAGQWHRVGDADWKLEFALMEADPKSGVIVAGESGVFRVRAGR